MVVNHSFYWLISFFWSPLHQGSETKALGAATRAEAGAWEALGFWRVKREATK